MTRLTHTCDTTHACLTHTHTHTQAAAEASAPVPTGPKFNLQAEIAKLAQSAKIEMAAVRRLPRGIIHAKEPCIPAKKSCVYP